MLLLTCVQAGLGVTEQHTLAQTVAIQASCIVVVFRRTGCCVALLLLAVQHDVESGAPLQITPVRIRTCTNKQNSQMIISYNEKIRITRSRNPPGSQKGGKTTTIRQKH